MLSSNRFSVNYIYYGLLFILLTILHISHILLVENGTLFSRLFFSVFAMGQSLLEVIALVIAGRWVQKRFSGWIWPSFIVFTFLLFLSHIVDFQLVRVMDWTLWYTLHFLTQESYKNLVEMLLASHVSLYIWFLGGILALSLVACGLIFFRMTEKVSAKKPILYSGSSLIRNFCVTLVLLAIWDVAGMRFALVPGWEQFQKTLPWKTTFFAPAPQELIFVSTLKKEKEASFHFDKAGQQNFSSSYKPNIFLFIAESLREDFITAQVAPHLFAFKEENVSFPLAFSNANATQMSWYSIFHAKFPFYWAREQNTGSTPLQILKKMGYKINVYSSSRLDYYSMDEKIFGKNCSLADSFHTFIHDENTPLWKSDANAMAKLREDITTNFDKEGNIFIIFLESTHFDYSWPEAKASRFVPFSEGINYFKATCSKDHLGEIKNRYRNAIYYVDTLFGRFVNLLKETEKWKDSIVIFTGDHGEEFYEHGHLFHASDLCYEQTHVPLYYKFPNGVISSAKMTSHIDIFPSLLHYLSGGEFFSQIFDGESIFAKEKWPFILSARYNASRSPCEFFLYNGQSKINLKFSREDQIFNCQSLQILGIENEKGELLPIDKREINAQFGEALDRLFGQ